MTSTDQTTVWTRRDVCVIVQGETWEDEPRPVVVPTGAIVCLVGEFGHGFDIRGPRVWLCRECGELVFIDPGDGEVSPLQLHYAEAHGFTPALLA